MRKLILLYLFTFGFSCEWLHAQLPVDPDRSDLDPVYAPFYHGVASGDPLSDRVILWTRITWDTTGPLVLNWKVATDTNLINVVSSGTATTDESRDYTVKVDASGLQPDTWYYYGFEWAGRKSLTGRTRTAPAPGADVDSARFAVVSCINYQTGFFTAYERIVNRNDVNAVIVLGDYIYEYEVGGFGYVAGAGRDHEPATEILNLSDYRTRHSQYKLDHDLRAVHQQFPFITIWDDHESANDSYRDGAANHTAGTEGDWNDRKHEAVRAYLEWMPIRQPDPADSQRIHRTIPWGDLARFILLDTRLEGRDEQVLPGDPLADDTTRHIISPAQMQWLQDELSDTSQQWKIITQQVMIAPLEIFGIAFNLDQWDGYTADRKRLLDFIMGNQIQNTVVLTGDIHTSWGNDIPHPDSSYNSSTGQGSATVEFVSPSVTSPNTPFPIGANLIQLANPHIKYADLTRHGFTVLDINRQRTQCDWRFVTNIYPPVYDDFWDDGWFVNVGERWLEHASGPLAPPATQQPLAPLNPDNPPLAGRDHAVTVPQELVIVSLHPVPFRDELVVEYYQYDAGAVALRLVNAAGVAVMEAQTKSLGRGLHLAQLSVDAGLPAGAYWLVMEKDGERAVRKVVKE